MAAILLLSRAKLLLLADWLILIPRFAAGLIQMADMLAGAGEHTNKPIHFSDKYTLAVIGMILGSNTVYVLLMRLFREAGTCIYIYI